MVLAMTSPLRNESLNPLDQHSLNVAKDAFRSSWESGLPLRIEDCLQVFSDSLRPTALRELLLLEANFRRAAGDPCSLAEYATRFPEHAELIAQVFSASLPLNKTPSANSPKGETIDNGLTLLVGGQQNLQQSAPVNPSTDTKSVPKQFGRYHIDRELGRGGMGVVYLAHDAQLDRKVALKIPFFKDDEDGPESVERFYREARAMATVQHANLCPVFDVGKFERWHFLTMAFIDGQPLSKHLKDAGTLATNDAVTLLRKVAAAVQKAHESGIVHRDLKPSNIMLTSDNEPVIMDFGLARRRSAGEAELTQSGAVFGSPAYMAPEQVEARHNEIGPATDVYALGVILYQLLTGHRPFEGSAASIFGQIVSRPPASPSSFRSDLPPEIDAICLKALAKSPSERHASAAEFADELARFSDMPRDLSPTISFRPDLDSRSAGARSGSDRDSDTPSVSRSRRDAELRLVTIAIFNYETDESSFVESSAASHSEQMHEQAQSFASFVSEQVARLGGVTVLGSGQEVITCFGFPQAFEDAAQRAVRVALQVMNELAATAPNSVGMPAAGQAWVTIHSGEAVAELLSDAKGAGISLVGDARNMAVRLNSVAELGSIVLSSVTHQRVALYFECETLGAQRVRGMAQPVELFKVVKEAASRNRVELVDPGNLTPLVGRDTELTILKDRWEQALEELGQIVLLIGDAGLGKSRLIRELREHVIREDSEGAAVIEWRCSQYHQGTSFFPIVEFLSRLLDFENLSPADRLDKVIRYLRELKIESAENVSLLCGMLNVPTDARFPTLTLTPQKHKERTEELLLKWLTQLVAISPVLFIVEDLHWLDPSTLELLEKYVAEFESGRMLSLLTFRPEFETPWKSKPHQTQIALSRLTKRQIGEMMRKRTHRQDIPETILQQVIARTDGVPLFIEEFTAVIVESGILDRVGADDASLMNVIPASLHDLLLARLDRMAADREVIQLAATIGREFGFRLLAAACSLPEAQLQLELGKLVKAEILFQKGQGTSAGYIFKHALLQDAAYRSMLSKKRQACHRRIGEVLEQQFPETAAAEPELLAQHFTEAGVLDSAIQYWLKAGVRARERSADVEAIRHLTRGLELIATKPPGTARDGEELQFQMLLSASYIAVRGYAASEVEEHIQRARELCEQLGPSSPLFHVMMIIWALRFIRGQSDPAVATSKEILALADSRDDSYKTEAYWSRTASEFWAGDFEQTLALSQRGVSLYQIEASLPHAEILQQNCGPLMTGYVGWANWMLGFPEQGLRWQDQALILAETLKDKFSLVVTHWHYAFATALDGNGARTLELANKVITVSEEQSYAFWIALGLGIKGTALRISGQHADAVPLLQDSLTRCEAIGSGILHTMFLGELAEALWRTGQRPAAWEAINRALTHNDLKKQRAFEAELKRRRAMFLLEESPQNASEAETVLLDAIAVAQRQKARMFELRSSIALATHWAKTGRPGEARQLVECVYNTFTEGANSPDLIAARAFLAMNSQPPMFER